MGMVKSCIAVLAGLAFAGPASGEGFEARIASVSAELSAAAAAPEMKDLNQRELLDLMRDPDPAVRKAALRSARYMISSRTLQERAIWMLNDGGEPEDVRVEAARALSYASQDRNVQGVLMDASLWAETPLAVRVMSLKALWFAAGSSRDPREFLMATVRRAENPALRNAAVWGLFDAARNREAREFLTDLLDVPGEPAFRLECVKSLYNGVQDWRVQEALFRVINDVKEAAEVREAAMLALSGANGDPRVRRFLADAAADSAETFLKVAAIEAQSPNPAKMRKFFHLGFRPVYGGFVSPLED